MKKANVRAINYLWQKISEKSGNILTIRDKKQKYIKSKNHKYLLIYTSDKSVPHCAYNSYKSKLSQNKINCNQMTQEMIDKAVDFAEKTI